MKHQPIIVIHGGAASHGFKEKIREHISQSLERILQDAYELLASGNSAKRAVVRAVELLENDPQFNAGLGSKIQADGKIRMSASLIDSKLQKFSGCVNVQGIKNPIFLARALQDQDFRVLSEAGGEKFARLMQHSFASSFTKERLAEYQNNKKGYTGTVGAIALDSKGHLAAATSTGGRGMEFPHRVSDTPTVAGNFANRFAAVSVTGIGEHIVDHAAAARLVAWIERGDTLNRACARLMSEAKKRNSRFGLIALTRDGRIKAVTSSKNLIWGAMSVREKILNP